MREKILIFILIFLCVYPAWGQGAKVLIIDDFEGPISIETVDFGTGRGSELEISADKSVKFSGAQSLKVVYNAVSGGYMWIARGYDLDVKGAGAWVVLPENINWKDYSAISFYMCGGNSKNKIAFDIKDSGNEIWRFITEDNFTGWKQIVCPFAEFFARSDWQPQDADKNSTIDFPIKSFQFEPLPEGKGTLYLDCVELIQEK